MGFFPVQLLCLLFVLFCVRNSHFVKVCAIVIVLVSGVHSGSMHIYPALHNAIECGIMYVKRTPYAVALGGNAWSLGLSSWFGCFGNRYRLSLVTTFLACLRPCRPVKYKLQDFT